MATRTSRSVRSPTAAVMRRTCRLPPSRIAIQIPVVRTVLRTWMGGFRDRRSGVGRGRDPGRLGDPFHRHPIGLPPLVDQMVLNGAVVGQQQESLGVLVQPAGGVYAGNRDVIREGALTGYVAKLAAHAEGLVEQQGGSPDRRGYPPRRRAGGSGR